MRKGLLSYRKYRTQIENIIPDNHVYIFGDRTTDAFEEPENTEKNARDTLYGMIDRKVEELKEHGVEEEDIYCDSPCGSGTWLL